MMEQFYFVLGCIHFIAFMTGSLALAFAVYLLSEVYIGVRTRKILFWLESSLTIALVSALIFMFVPDADIARIIFEGKQ